MPPRLGCALSATEVQSSRENLNLVYTQVNKHASQALTLRLNFAVSKRSVDQAVNYGPRGTFQDRSETVEQESQAFQS